MDQNLHFPTYSESTTSFLGQDSYHFLPQQVQRSKEKLLQEILEVKFGKRILHMMEYSQI